jgi:hypothetical protein
MYRHQRLLEQILNNDGSPQARQTALQSLITVFINNIANLSIEYLDYNCTTIFLLSYLQPVAAEYLSKDDLIS